MRTEEREVCPAYLTVYLSIIMAILLSLCLALIEGARSNGIRLEAECVMDIGLNSVLAEYHRELLGQYNLFAIDCSYGTDYAGKSNTEQHLKEYMQRNFSMEDIFLSDWFYKDFLALSVENVDLTKVSLLTDEKGAVFRKRAVEAIKDDIGLTLLEDILQWTQTVESQKLLERNIAQEKSLIDTQIQEYDGRQIQVSETEWITAQISNPTNALEELRARGSLQNVVEDVSLLSNRSIDSTALIGNRMEQGRISVGNIPLEAVSEAEQLTERFFFQEYLMKYMSRYGEEKEDSALLYQMEYVVAGRDNDLENLKSVADTLCAMREVANVIYLYSDETKSAEAELLATVLAALMQVPDIASLLKAVLILGWAYAESLHDVKTLLAGGRIPLIKDSSTWHYGLEGALQSAASEETDNQQGLTYEDYLRILMMFVDVDTLTARAMNMVEADIRRTPGNSQFRLDACYDCVEANVVVKSEYGYEYQITRQKRYY